MRPSQFSLLSLLAGLSGLVHAGHVETRHFTAEDGASYTYDYAPAQGENSTLLFLHGFPSTRHDWKHQAANFSSAGYGVIAPDMLGFGDSDRPLELDAYRLKRLSGHINELVKSHDLESVVGVGHDWGTLVLSRSLYWHAELFEKVAFLSTGYYPAGIFTDVDAINAASLKEHGYTQFGYWYFFNSYNAADLLEEKLESTHSLVFHRNQSAWVDDLANIGAARAWLNANTTTPLADYLTEDDKKTWMKAYSRKDSFAASLNIYQSILRGTHAKDEEGVSDEGRMINVPVLSVGGLKDVVARADQLHQTFDDWATAGHMTRDLDAGHWMLFEDPDGVSSSLHEFLGQE